MPELYIITGSNGAGKSTIGSNYLPLSIQEKCPVFDGDKLFMEKQRELWKNGITAHKEAKKIAYSFVEETFNSLVESAISGKNDFVYEGHFTNEATWDIPKKFKANQYKINMIFFGLTDISLSESRVIKRTKVGGHYVNPETIASNFYGNLEKLNKHFILFDILAIIDTSESEHRLLCFFENGEPTFSIASRHLPHWFQYNLPKLLGKVIEYELNKTSNNEKL